MSLELNRVLILDNIDQICENILKQAGIEVTIRPKLTTEDLIKELNVHDGVIVRSATKITTEVLENVRGLKVVGRAGTGVDNINVDAATRKGILVMNTPGGNTLSAAEHTCSLICSLSRSIPQACMTLKGGAWDRKKFMGNELYGKVLAIVGLGRIGKEVTDRMKSFGMRVIGYDPIVSPETAASWGVEYLTLEKLWPLADYITVHTPLIPQTKYLINEKVFRSCKPTVKIVNVARGGIVEEKALLEALNNGYCGGAALDVFEEEPPKDLTLVQHPKVNKYTSLEMGIICAYSKVICTPHLGANTYEAQKRVAVEIAEQLVAMSQGKQLIGVVNVPALADAGSPLLQPWIELSSSLGILGSSLIGNSKAKKLSVNFRGSDVSKYPKLLAPALLKGYLKSTYSEVNLVNAPTLAKDANVEIEVDLNGEATENSIQLVVECETGMFSVQGAVQGENPTLCSINDCHFSSGVNLKGNLQFFLTGFGADLVGALLLTPLKDAHITAILSSWKSDEGYWIVVRTWDPPADIPKPENCKLMFKTQF
ncbi:D-3-phosphoglycerate dehydrogenase [Armadillidium nasatum]|uniref:D-3-phosphoglycerate dehydrogenase n=1 Tax=Armadillidium nasatum TaxID=96803 RepID=A0A5N5TE61_9CRUS|nr:D-3-phosphoglycerate dehydrogenase [Armadillidium nasatum]